MGMRWSMHCPYCKAEFANGWGYGDTFPVIWVPFIRCYVCGKLFSTHSHEFLTIPPGKRLKYKNNQKICKLIEQSLDRTNNQEYVKILMNKGLKIYPINNDDQNKFTGVDFNKYEDALPSKEATQLLYDTRILIKNDELDKRTGTYKKEILEERQKNYNINRKAQAWGGIIGLIVGIISCSTLSMKGSGNLWPLGIVIGFFTSFVTFMGIYFLDSIKNRNSKQTNDKEVTQQTNYSSKEKNMLYLKKLFKEGIITEKEYKEKINKIIDDID